MEIKSAYENEEVRPSGFLRIFCLDTTLTLLILLLCAVGLAILFSASNFNADYVMS